MSMYCNTLQTNEEAVVATKLCHVFWTRRQSQTVSEYCQLLKSTREDFILHYGHFFKELIKVSVPHQAKTVHKLSIRKVWRHQRGNQKLHNGEGQTMQWPREGQMRKNCILNTIQKRKEWARRIPQCSWVDPGAMEE
jgi:hypothetical protein